MVKSVRTVVGLNAKRRFRRRRKRSSLVLPVLVCALLSSLVGIGGEFRAAVAAADAVLLDQGGLDGDDEDAVSIAQQPDEAAAGEEGGDQGALPAPEDSSATDNDNDTTTGSSTDQENETPSDTSADGDSTGGEGGGGAPSEGESSSSSSNKKPNLLLIVTDQQRYDTLGIVQRNMKAYKSKVRVRTPNLDRLAEMGTLFDVAYCGSASCAPSRAVLRTGNTLQRTGISRNRMVGDDFINRIPFIRKKVEALESFEQVLVDHCGYEAVSFGKWHSPKRLYYSNKNNVQRAVSSRGGRRNNKEKKKKLQQKQRANRILSCNYFDFEDQTFKFAPMQILHPIYRRAVSYLTKRDKIKPKFRPGQQRNKLSDFPYTPAKLDPRYGKPTNTVLSRSNGFRYSEMTFATIYGKDSLPTQLTPTGITARMALKALNRLLIDPTTTKSENDGDNYEDETNDDSNSTSTTQQEQQKRPWSMALHFLAPHPPILSTNAFATYYTENQKRLFVSPSISDPMKNSAYADSNGRGRPGAFSGKAKVQEVTAVYYGMIEEIDHWIGKIIQRLEDAGELDNTMIIYTSDHGEMLGAHGMKNKFNLLEEATRVPLFITFPNQIPASNRVRVPVMHMDIFATILDYLGASKYDKSDGRSLRRHIEHRSFSYNHDDRTAVSEIDGRVALGRNRLSGKLGEYPNFMVRWRNWKLIITKKKNSKVLDMMYNLKTDQYETRNLLGKNGKRASPEHIGKAEHLKILLMEWMVRHTGPQKYYSSPKYNLGEGRGDVQEIRSRRTWRRVPYWQSDPVVKFSRPVYRRGLFRRNEYFYVGRTADGVLTITDIRLVQKNGEGNFQCNKVRAVIKKNRYVRIKIAFTSETQIPIKSLGAFLEFKTNIKGKENVRVKIL